MGKQNPQGLRIPRKRGLKPAKRSLNASALLVRSKPSGAASGYALGAKFFFFSFIVFFFLFWFLFGERGAWFVLLPCVVLGFGAALLLYALFSLIGWARPLLETIVR